MFYPLTQSTLKSKDYTLILYSTLLHIFDKTTLFML